MTEPDEAILWARERAARWQDENGGEAGPSYRSGKLDFLLGEEVEGYRAGQAASAERIKALEEELAKANEPQWFYDDRAADEAQSFLSAEEAVDYAVFSALGPLPEGTSILEINTSRPCPSVWAVVKIFTDEEREARDDDEEYIVTLCATEAEARALLKEADQ
ncbi:MAG: hypothetical protein INH43_20925 [Acidobacteriaceae bacterium]|nr:hypothetical protein [Acidobacteriaceae bacterium]